MRSAIICVDDDKFLVEILAEQLKGWVGQNYTVEKAQSGEEALDILDGYLKAEMPVSLVISDYIMPVMSGDELLTKIHEKDKSIRTIMLTGYAAIDGIVNAINRAGLYRFITKPWDKKDLMLTVLEAIRSYEQEKNNKILMGNFEKLYRSYETQLEYIIGTVAGAIDLRTHAESGHSRNVEALSRKIGAKAGMNADALKALGTMAAFHDIGKVVLSDEELSVIKSKEALIYDFPEYMAKQNAAAEKVFSVNPQMDKTLLKGVVNHFERFDGGGVKRIKGIAIPLEARIIAIASFYDILTSTVSLVRPMRPASALEMLSGLKESIFDPDLINILYSLNLNE